MEMPARGGFANRLSSNIFMCSVIDLTCASGLIHNSPILVVHMPQKPTSFPEAPTDSLVSAFDKPPSGEQGADYTTISGAVKFNNAQLVESCGISGNAVPFPVVGLKVFCGIDVRRLTGSRTRRVLWNRNV